MCSQTSPQPPTESRGSYESSWVAAALAAWWCCGSGRASSAGCAACSGGGPGPARPRRAPRSPSPLRSSAPRMWRSSIDSSDCPAGSPEPPEGASARRPPRAVRGPPPAPARRQDHRALDHVLQLAHVARPGVAAEPPHRSSGPTPSIACPIRGVTCRRRTAPAAGCPRRAPAAAAAAAGTRSGGSTGPRGIVLSRNRLQQVAVGRGDDAHVDRSDVVAADALELALLQHAQQLDLQLRRQLADLVEEDRPAVGQLEPADAPGDRAGERALLVPEQLALDQARRQRGAVDLDQRLVLAARWPSGWRGRSAPCPCRSRR